MGQMPMGKSGVEYDEVCMLVRAYAEKLAVGGISYADMLKNLDRMASLAQEARKLWGDR